MSAAERDDGCRRAPGLLLYLLFENRGEKAAVELAADATVQELRAAAHEAGGPAPHRQVLAVGADVLTDSGSTPLSDTCLISNEAVVAVRARRAAAAVVCCRQNRVAVILEGGAVRQFTLARKEEQTPVAAGCTAVVAGFGFTAAIVEGRLEVWGFQLRAITAGKPFAGLQGRQAVSCAASAGFRAVLAVVDSESHLHLCGDAKSGVPSELQGRVAAVAMWGVAAVVLTHGGEVFVVDRGGVEKKYLGGRPAMSISASGEHWAAVLDDGTVRCFGSNEKGECDVPSDLRSAVSCACGRGSTAAVCADGSVRWWGTVGVDLGSRLTAPCAAMALDEWYAAAVTSDGSLLATCTRRCARMLSRLRQLQAPTGGAEVPIDEEWRVHHGLNHAVAVM
eukprot:TRINITY_DN861_c0_g1_i6.p1 TRINITY_DN861_c0_g1~~TRINITY_DN861_c0_g1_i6.p1  ORF type:complete len:413 (+),score=117.57 TRINITY_DN861_c0_g1_i6:63-1241(+)